MNVKWYCVPGFSSHIGWEESKAWLIRDLGNLQRCGGRVIYHSGKLGDLLITYPCQRG